jgi:hypothetical protein
VSELNHNEARNLDVDTLSPTKGIPLVQLVASLFTNMLCGVVANALKTVVAATTALKLDEYFFYSDGG